MQLSMAYFLWVAERKQLPSERYVIPPPTSPRYIYTYIQTSTTAATTSKTTYDDDDTTMNDDGFFLKASLNLEQRSSIHIHILLYFSSLFNRFFLFVSSFYCLRHFTRKWTEHLGSFLPDDWLKPFPLRTLTIHY